MSNVSTAPTGVELSRLCKALGASGGDLMTAERFAESRNWWPTVEVIKALTSPLSVADLESSMAPIGYDLSAVLRPMTLLGRLQGTTRVPFLTRVMAQSVGGSGAFIDEGQPVPVTEAGLAATVTLAVKKCSGIRVLTAELLRSGAPGTDRLVADDVAGAVAEGVDAAFIDPANPGNDFTPAAITSGATEITSTGSGIAQIDTDLGDMVQILINADMSLTTATWIMNPKTATFLSLLRGSSGAPAYPLMNARGGFLLGLPVLTSTSVTASGSPGERFVALVEASEILVADDNKARVELSTSAALQMNDAPVAGDQNLVSLFQHGLVGVKLTKFANWLRRRSGAVAVLRNVVY